MRLLAIIAALLLAAGTAQAQEQPAVVKLDYPRTFEAAIGRFEGRVIYVDVLASWCKPCIAELEAAPLTADFFRANDIVKLYISVDVPSGIDPCYSLLRGPGIEGYFLTYHNPRGMNRDSERYCRREEDFFTTRGPNGNITGVAVPQYLIIDREGNVADYKAPRPSNPEALKEELSKYL